MSDNTDELQRKRAELIKIDMRSVELVARALLASETRARLTLVGIDDGGMLRRMVETGLVVTYARPFTRSDGYGQIDDDWVPAEHLDLHRFLMTRRHQYYAHSDAAGDIDHTRVVDINQGPSVAFLTTTLPDELSLPQLEELAELAAKIHRTAFERRHLTARPLRSE